MSLKDLIGKVNNGDSVTALKKEFCHELEQLDNEEFMKAYNIYYKNEKLNKSPLNHKGLVEVFKRNTIKKQSVNGIVSIPTKDCNIIEITIV